VEVLLQLIVCLAIVGAVLFAALGSLNWVLGPLDRAAKNRQFPIQFSLADLLCLFVLVQLPLGAVHSVLHWVPRGGEFHAGVLVVDLVVALLAASVWWTYVRTLSRAGIHVVWHRCVALCIALPAAFVGSVAMIVLPLVAVGLLVGRETSTGLWMLLAVVAIGGALYGLGRFTRAIVAAAEAARTKPPLAPMPEPRRDD
jgi:hypothetical protein